MLTNDQRRNGCSTSGALPRPLVSSDARRPPMPQARRTIVRRVRQNAPWQWWAQAHSRALHEGSGCGTARDAGAAKDDSDPIRCVRVTVTSHSEIRSSVRLRPIRLEDSFYGATRRILGSQRRRSFAGVGDHVSFGRAGSGASMGCARKHRILGRPNRFSCNGTFPVGPKRSVITRRASSERILMLMDAMSEFEASNRNCHIGKRLEAFH
jgi:hypothetical protein